MTHDEIKSLIDRSLFATTGCTDEQGSRNVRREFEDGYALCSKQ